MKLEIRVYDEAPDWGLWREACLYPMPRKVAKAFYESDLNPPTLRTLYLHRVWVKANKRRDGHGTALLKQVCGMADRLGYNLILRVRPFDAKGLKAGKLRRWYGEWGFKPLTGDLMFRVCSHW